MVKIGSRKRADGTVAYRVQFRADPSSAPTTETFTTAEAAQRFIDTADEIGWKAAQRIRHATAASAGHVPTLAAWLETHLAELAASVTPGTVHGYRREAERTWLPRLGRWPIDQISREHVTSWLAWQRRQETQRSVKARARAAANGAPIPPPVLMADKTLANAHGLLSSVLAAAGRRYGLANVAEGVRLPSDQAREEMTFLTPAEYDRLLAVVPDYWKPLVAFLAGTGCRWGEATALTVGDMQLDGDRPHVTISRAWKRGERGSAYLGGPKTRRGRRTVMLDPVTVATIRHLVDGRAPSALVFQGVRGARVHAQNFHPRVWDPAVAASGIGKRPRVHDLRHSHASWLIGAGVPLIVVQYRLGHESIKTTSDRYGHLMPGAGDLAADAIGRALSGVTSAPLAGELLPPT